MADSAVLGLFTQPFITNIILPFLLVFVVVFAILEKTNLLGEGKRYANLIVGIIIGFLFVGVQAFVGFTIKLIPLVTVFLIILLMYFLIFGFIGIHELRGLRIALGIVFGLALVFSALWAAGLLAIWTSVYKADFIGIVTLIVVLGGAVGLIMASRTRPPTA